MALLQTSHAPQSMYIDRQECTSYAVATVDISGFVVSWDMIL